MKLRSHQRGLSRAVLAVLGGLLVLTSAGAQQTFEGFVTVGQFGRFPTGLYGATNLVPPNSLVLVQNLETGQTERVIITEGVDQPGVFLVLAPAAAELLGVSASGTVRARVSEIATSDIRRSDDRIERALSQDPDVNPAAGGTSLLDTLPPPVGVDEPAEEPAQVAEREPDPEPEPKPTEEPAIAESAPELPLPEERPDEAEPTEPPLSEPEDPEPSERGVAEGVARTSAAQAQEEFARPDRSLSQITPPRPDEVFVTAEPSADQAIGDLDTTERLVAPREQAPTRLVEPSQQPPAIADEVMPPEEPQVAPIAEPEDSIAVEPGPIEAAIASLSARLPAKDRFPRSSAAGDDPSIARVDTPEDTLVAALPQVSPPPQRVAAAEEPSLAGLGPLAPAATPFDPLLVEAQPIDEERPDATLAGPAPEVRDPDATLAEAEPVGEERPDATLAGPTPVVRDPDASLAEAEPVGDERPEAAISGPQPEEVATDGELAEAQPVDEERPEEPLAAFDPEGTVEPPPEDAVLALEPADFRPPESEPEPTVPEPEPEPEAIVEQPEPAEEPEAEPEPEPVVVEREPAPRPERPALPIVEELEDEQFYLQIGAYGDPATAEVTVNALAATYPMSVLPIDRGAQTLYRVLVGPVNRDETGTLLLFLRARGYADAFLRSGNEL